ncbi:Thiol-disulfide isomerase-like protein [uncultured Desulfobacterium sp.]|uniref:Thiol-disulfide isomerase-like protein n=1 Tax=uncultured Desulfobacterium sp. TaxID=201089 RepID=A0A445MWQ8_9BACT|nr:Thiol-disulfide isomerase-like protein [uncultured Desulfobacterium sp.]
MSYRLNSIFNKLIFVSVLAFTIFGCKSDIAAGPAAPDFSLKDLSDKTVTLKQYRGSIVVLDFWATWCPPCRAAIPELVAMQEKYRDKKLAVIGISMDDPRKVTNEYLRSFSEKFNINYIILRFDLKVVEDYFGAQAPALPTLYIIDRDGQVRDKLVGFDPDALQSAVERLLK